ncbi:MAG: hypothetical protein ACLPX5_04375 [Dissulfurispiraceae bacterium]
MQKLEREVLYDKPCQVHQGPYSVVLSSKSRGDGGSPTGFLTYPNKPDRAALLGEGGELEHVGTMTKCGGMALDRIEARRGRRTITGRCYGRNWRC